MMTYYNQNPLMQQIFGRAPTRQTPTVSPEQLFSVTSTLDKASLSRLVNQARQQGISDKDIQEGLNILLQHR